MQERCTYLRYPKAPFLHFLHRFHAKKVLTITDEVVIIGYASD